MREKESNGNTPGTTYSLPLSSISKKLKIRCNLIPLQWNQAPPHRTEMFFDEKTKSITKFNFPLSKRVRLCRLVIEFAAKMTQNCLLIQLNILFYAMFLQSKGMCMFIVQ